MEVPGPPVFDESSAGCEISLQKAPRVAYSARPTTAGAPPTSSPALGVEFTQEPMERPYGIDAGYRDILGNQVRLVQGA